MWVVERVHARWHACLAEAQVCSNEAKQQASGPIIYQNENVWETCLWSGYHNGCILSMFGAAAECSGSSLAQGLANVCSSGGKIYHDSQECKKGGKRPQN